MIFSALLKKLKKSLRRKIRWISLASILVVFIYSAIQLLPSKEERVEETLADIAIEASNRFSDPNDEWNEQSDNAYFGIDDNGHLSLFDGDPEANQIIRTFFQLDIDYLESSLPHETVMQLYQGIRVSDQEEFNSVLSTFSPFAVEVTEKMMEP